VHEKCNSFYTSRLMPRAASSSLSVKNLFDSQEKLFSVNSS
jgi:hypothetical protein